MKTLSTDKNDDGSERYREIYHDNLNKPMSQLVCPRCEAKAARRDDSDHPGSFECSVCTHQFLA